MPAQTDENAIFDRDLLLAFRRRALARAEPGADFLLQRIADDLADRLDAVERRFPVAVDVAGHTGLALAPLHVPARRISWFASSGTEASCKVPSRHRRRRGIAAA